MVSRAATRRRCDADGELLRNVSRAEPPISLRVPRAGLLLARRVSAREKARRRASRLCPVSSLSAADCVSSARPCSAPTCRVALKNASPAPRVDSHSDRLSLLPFHLFARKIIWRVGLARRVLCHPEGNFALRVVSRAQLERQWESNVPFGVAPRVTGADIGRTRNVEAYPSFRYSGKVCRCLRLDWRNGSGILSV